MSDKVIASVNVILHAMRDRIAQEVKTALTDEIQRQIGSIVVRDGRDGVDGRPGIAINGKDGEPGKDAVVNEEKIISEIMTKIPQMRMGKRSGGGSTMRVNDLSSQANGVTKTFTTLNKIGTAHLLHYSSFPSIFVPTTDYTVSTNVITLGASIPAPVAGQSLVFIYESSD